jgi:hypothetical protein
MLAIGPSSSSVAFLEAASAIADFPPKNGKAPCSTAS